MSAAVQLMMLLNLDLRHPFPHISALQHYHFTNLLINLITSNNFKNPNVSSLDLFIFDYGNIIVVVFFGKVCESMV